MQFFAGTKLPLALLLLLLVSFALSNTNIHNHKAVHKAGTCKRGRIHCNGGCRKKCTRNAQCHAQKLRCKPCKGTKGRRHNACQL